MPILHRLIIPLVKYTISFFEDQQTPQAQMNLENLGYNKTIEKYWLENAPKGFLLGRVIAEHKERYVVNAEQGEFDAEITGNLRFTAKNRDDFPAVGDWVALMGYDSNSAIIQSILPRQSILARQAVGKFGEKQIIAANVDYALILQSLDRDFNLNRLERYLTICHTSRVSPVVVLTKTDLATQERLDETINIIRSRIKNAPVLSISCITKQGYETLMNELHTGKTYCLLGSSGVGKSTLVNMLLGKATMKTGAISEASNRGKHVTSHRELFILENGAIVIDNPGMRDGLKTTFDDIMMLAENCRYNDCTHTNERGCAIIEAVESGEIDRTTYENYLKLQREELRFEQTTSEKRRRDKEFGKMVKNIKNDLKKVNSKYAKDN